MMKRIITTYLFALLTFLSMPLSALVEYDIINLAPPDYHPGPNVESIASEACELTESGYVIGTVTNYLLHSVQKGFIFHPLYGFKIIDVPLIGGHVEPQYVNNSGVVVGHAYNCEWHKEIFKKEGIPFWDGGGPRNFMFDSMHDSSPHVIDIPEVERNVVSSRQERANCHLKGISDCGKMLFDVWNGNSRFWLTNLKLDGSAMQDLRSKGQFWQLDGRQLFAITSNGEIIGRDWLYSIDNQQMWDFASISSSNLCLSATSFTDTGVVAGLVDRHGEFPYSYNILWHGKKGFVWNREEGLEIIPTLGGEKIFVVSVNNLGQVVGFSNTKNVNSHAFLFDKSRRLIDLNTLGGKESQALDINDHMQIVGTAHSASKINTERAFVWDPVNGMRDLNILIPANSGWKKLTAAIKINNEGLIIGKGVYLGEKRAFLLIPKNQNTTSLGF